MEAVEVEREDTPVMFLRARDFPADISAAWERLESRFESLRGRKFIGSFYPATQDYRACVATQPGDDAAALGLETGVLPGGRYARVRLRGEPPAVYERIPTTFVELGRQRSDYDDRRPSLEYYRRRDEIDLLLPIA